MDPSRRDLLAGSALAFGASALALGSPSAEVDAGDEAAVTRKVEILRKGLFEADKAKLEQVTAAQLSYGHSGGRIENREQFVNAVVTRTQVVKSLAFPDLKVAVAGNAAIVRHLYVSESETDGKASTLRIGVLEVWQKQDGDWKLLARQGFVLPA
jgi:hypothetical protein